MSGESSSSEDDRKLYTSKRNLKADKAFKKTFSHYKFVKKNIREQILKACDKHNKLTSLRLSLIAIPEGSDVHLAVHLLDFITHGKKGIKINRIVVKMLIKCLKNESGNNKIHIHELVDVNKKKCLLEAAYTIIGTCIEQEHYWYMLVDAIFAHAVTSSDNNKIGKNCLHSHSGCKVLYGILENVYDVGFRINVGKLKYLISKMKAGSINQQNAGYNGMNLLVYLVHLFKKKSFIYVMLDLFQYLLDHGADITQRDHSGNTVINHLALKVMGNHVIPMYDMKDLKQKGKLIKRIRLLRIMIKYGRKWIRLTHQKKSKKYRDIISQNPDFGHTYLSNLVEDFGGETGENREELILDIERQPICMVRKSGIIVLQRRQKNRLVEKLRSYALSLYH
jgi:hypothetical protein